MIITNYPITYIPLSLLPLRVILIFKSRERRDSGPIQNRVIPHVVGKNMHNNRRYAQNLRYQYLHRSKARLCRQISTKFETMSRRPSEVHCLQLPAWFGAKLLPYQKMKKWEGSSKRNVHLGDLGNKMFGYFMTSVWR